jgi:hypothetical protein
MQYESVAVVESTAAPGVTYTVARMSFGRRVELMRRIREVAQQVEYLAAGEEPRERMDAALASVEIDRAYVLWGLRGVGGLEVDGEKATPETLAAAGPEELFREALAAIKAECGLTEAERGN